MQNVKDKTIKKLAQGVMPVFNFLMGGNTGLSFKGTIHFYKEEKELKLPARFSCNWASMNFT